ncbi:hypothetical protein JHW43_007900 [Diplocarpon mali]|nr:hypothetical protein JHW43_007900 [Diplocarpon mali]
MRFLGWTPYSQPSMDEIEEPSDPPTIVLMYLDDHLLHALMKRTLNQELKAWGIRFSDVQLSDLGGTYPDFMDAQAGSPARAPRVPFSIYKHHLRRNSNLVRPCTVSSGHEEYGLRFLKYQLRYFAPFMAKRKEIASLQTITAIVYLTEEILRSQEAPFYSNRAKEACKDNEFSEKIVILC